MYLLYSGDVIPGKDLHNANAHYDAIVLKKKNNDGDESVFQLPEDDDILRPSQLFTPARPQLHPELAKYNVTENDGYCALVCRRTPTLLSNSNQFKGIFYG